MRYLKLIFDDSNSERPDFSADMTVELCYTENAPVASSDKDVPLRARSPLHMQQAK